MQSHSPCHPMQCILPPYMVDAIKMRGGPDMQKMVREHEKQAAQYRERRAAMTPPTAFAPIAALPMTAKPKPDRAVFDAGGKLAPLPGAPARDESGWSDPQYKTDRAVNDAFNGAGDVFKLYLDVYRRNSLDGNGLRIVSSVHYGNNVNNAFWNGTQMLYGDGDGVLFKPLTGSRTVIGHELTHGVVQFSGGLIYQDQSGALNESVADVFGALTIQYKRDQDAKDADWLIGDGILGPDIAGDALRSLRAPGTAYGFPVPDALLGTDPQPFHMDGFVVTSSDHGGVHLNSGIPNHAFYQLAILLGGKAWERAGQIWYDALQDLNNPLATFSAFADATVEAARTRYGSGSLEQLMTRRSWQLVGVSL